MGKIKTFSKIEVEKDTITYKNAIIQTSNVSKISLEPMEKMKIPFSIIVSMILVSTFLYIFGKHELSVLLFVISTTPFFYVSSFNSDLGIYLVLSLNSGEKVYFACREKDFLESAFKYIVESIRAKKTANINFSNCTINSVNGDLYTGDNVQGDKVQGEKTKGESNVLVSGVKNTVEKNDIQGDRFYGDKVHGDKVHGDKKIVMKGNENRYINGDEVINNNNGQDWEEAEKIFRELLLSYRVDTEQYDFCEMAEIYCVDKNSKGLEYLIEHRRSIFDSIVTSLASTAFVELIKRLTGIIY